MQAEAPAPSIRVLLIEDDEDDYRLTRELLAEVPGYQIEPSSGRRAMRPVLARWRAVRTTCVSSTTGWASCTGLDLLRRASGRTGIPFIVLTGYSAFELDVEAMRAGAADYLP